MPPRLGTIVCSSRESTIRVAWPTYFFGMMNATESAATMVATSASMNALRRARRASRNWLRSMLVLSLEEGFSHVDDVVGADGLLQPAIGFDPLAVGGGSSQLEPAVAAARGHAAARGDRLHHAHVGLDLVGARARDLAVYVEHGRALDVHRLAALQQVALADQLD